MNDVHRKRMEESDKELKSNEGFRITHSPAEAIKNGLNALARPVLSTMGANGLYHCFEEVKPWGKETKITNDGVTVANSIVPLKSPAENMIASYILEAAQKTAFVAGDGTTRTIGLIEYMAKKLITDINYKTQFKFLLNKKNPYRIIEGMTVAVDKALNWIEQNKKEVTISDLENIAFTSSHGNSSVAANIRNLYSQLDNWNIEVDFEAGTSFEDKIIMKSGYRIAKKSPSISTKVPPKLIEPRIILFNNKMTEFLKITQNICVRAASESCPVVIIVKHLANPDLVNLAKKHEETYKVPIYIVELDTLIPADKQFEDLRILSTGFFLDDTETTYGERDVVLKDLTNVKSIMNKDEPRPYYEIPVKSVTLTNEDVLIEFNTPKAIIDSYIDELREMEYTDIMDINNHANRVKKLLGLSCTYYVGGNSSSEIETAKYLVEDALMACKSAVRYGVLPGGAYSDIRLSEFLKYTKPESISAELSASEGYDAVVEALTYGLQIMCKSAYKNYNEIKSNYVQEKQLYNFKEFKYEDIETSKIMDSAATLIEALKNSQSVINHFIKLGTITY